MSGVGGVLKGRDIVCFSGEWNGDPRSNAQVMRILARENRVLWVESASGQGAGRFRNLSGAMHGLQERHPHLWALTPLSLPFEGNDLVRAANAALLKAQVQRAMQKLGFRDPINWSFTASSAPVAGTLGESLVVYHCADELGDSAGREARQLERRLLLNADVVLCSSASLRAEKERLNPNAHLVPDGVDLDLFRKALDPRTTAPPSLRGGPGPVIGMWGGIGASTDLALIRYVADAFSGGTVAVVGRAKSDLKALARSRNIWLLGPQPYADLPRYAKAFDVALVPIRVDDNTSQSQPAEVREYLAAGLPVVSTALPEVERLGLCHVGQNPDEVVRHISAIIAAGPGPKAERAARMLAEGWDGRVGEMEQIVIAALNERRTAA